MMSITQQTDDRTRVRPGDQPDVDAPGASDLDDGTHASFDYIDEAIEESMIASDPPAFTPHTTVGPPGQKNTSNRD